VKIASKRYVVFDVETTGLSADRGHRIIEIGAVAVNRDIMEEEFQSLIYTDKPFTKVAQKVHGITAAMLAGQPDAKEVLSTFRDFTGTSTLVAHNAAFDVSFLQREFMRAGLILNSRHKCTLMMTRKLFPGLPNYKLETVARHLGIPINMRKHHRALEDAKLAAQVWVEMRKIDG
jgi:DNA polymerase III subunit epsilon